MGPTAVTMQMDCVRDSWTCATAVHATLSVSGSFGSALTHICAPRESIQLNPSLKSSPAPHSFHPQPSRTPELDPYASIHTSTVVIHLSVYSFIHLSISSDCQASSPAQSLPIDPFWCFAHPWYKWVRTNFSAVRRTVCFISVSLNVSLGVGDIPIICQAVCIFHRFIVFVFLWTCQCFFCFTTAYSCFCLLSELNVMSWKGLCTKVIFVNENMNMSLFHNETEFQLMSSVMGV